MKLQKFQPYRLDSRGVMHHILPFAVLVLFAVGGTFVLVAKRAQTVNLANASTAISGSTGGAQASLQSNQATPASKSKVSKEKKQAFLAIYSQSGMYNSVQIKVNNPGNHKYYCGGALQNSSAVVTRKLAALQPQNNVKFPPLVISCEPTLGNATYQITYGHTVAKSEWGHVVGRTMAYDTDTAPVTVKNTTCTYVHADASKNHDVALQNGKCPEASGEEPLVPMADEMRSLPALGVKHKHIVGYIDLGVQGYDLKRAQCTGNFNVAYTNGNWNIPASVPVRYVHRLDVNGALGYCAAKLNLSIPKHASGVWTVTASYKGNPYLAQNSATASITVPAASK